MRRTSCRAAVVALVLGLGYAAFAQAPGTPAQPRAQTGARPGLPPRDNPTTPTGTARIRGRVFAADTNAGLRRAQVTITGAEGRVRRFVTTDAEGRYEFGELPAGQYTISASKGGYVTLQYGQQRPFEPGRPVALTDGQQVSQIDLALPRGSVIVGRVTDEFGEPIAGAMIQVQRYQYTQSGQRRLGFAGSAGFTQSDDLGQFRAFGLMPGGYVLSATVRAPMAPLQGANPNDVSEGYAPTFYPGTTNPADAQTITVGLAEELSIQMTLVAARLARIMGTVVDSQGKALSAATLMLRSGAGGGFSMSMAGQSSADGSFVLANVAPGEHRVEVRSMPRGTDPRLEFGSAPVNVSSEDIVGLTITTGRGSPISGRVTFEGTSSKTGGPGEPRVVVNPADPDSGPGISMFGGDPFSNGIVSDDGSFKLAETFGPVVFRVINVPAWMLKSVTLDGDDITDVPYDLKGQPVEGLRIVLTDKLTDISGGVSNARGQSLKDYVVVVQPREPMSGAAATRFTSTVRPDQDGRFRVRRLPPGAYVATAVEALEQGREWDPEYRPKLREAGKAFAIKEGESIVLDLRLADGL